MTGGAPIHWPARRLARPRWPGRVRATRWSCRVPGFSSAARTLRRRGGARARRRRLGPMLDPAGRAWCSEREAALVGRSRLRDHPDGLGQEQRGLGGCLVWVAAGSLLPASLDLEPGVGGAGHRVAVDGDLDGGGVGRAAVDGEAGQHVAVAPGLLGGGEADQPDAHAGQGVRRLVVAGQILGQRQGHGGAIAGGHQWREQGVIDPRRRLVGRNALAGGGRSEGLPAGREGAQGGRGDQHQGQRLQGQQPGHPRPVRLVVVPVVAIPQDGHHGQPDQDHPRGKQQRLEAGLDIGQGGVAGAQVQRHGADQEQDGALAAPVAHSSHHPTAQPEMTAVTRVRGAKRSAKRRPNTPVCRAISLRSTTGPTTMKTSRAVRENWLRLAATKASASEQTARTTASPARATTARVGLAATASSTDLGTTTWRVAAVMAPTTSQPPAWRKSCWAVWVNDCQRVWPSTLRWRVRSIQSSRPSRAHSRPTATAVASEARNRAATISGRPGNATAVETSTTGLMAGAASMNANAAAGAAPRAVSRPAIGTAPHSQPGRATPASPAAGTATSGCLGSARASHPGGTRAVIAPLSTTPRTRKGSAWTLMDTKIVVQVPRAGPSSSLASGPRRYNASTKASPSQPQA